MDERSFMQKRDCIRKSLSLMLFPSMAIFPFARVRCMMIFMSVDLPMPLRPRRA